MTAATQTQKHAASSAPDPYWTRLARLAQLAVGKSIAWQTYATGLLCMGRGTVSKVALQDGLVACEWHITDVTIMRANGTRIQPPTAAILLVCERIDLPRDLGNLTVLKLPVRYPTIAAEVTFDAAT